MELKEFIKTAITDITEAVSELQNELKNGAIVSPSMPTYVVNKMLKDPRNDRVNRLISNIDFDVAITVGDADKIEAKGKAGIQIFTARMGGESESHVENVSRLTFSIPVALPSEHVRTPQEISDDKHRQRVSEHKTSFK